jgi:YfiH family protein
MNWIQSQGLSGVNGIVHGFSNKKFNGNLSDAARYFGLSKISTLNQIHSSDVIIIKDGFKDVSREKGDAMITSLKGIGIGVFTADCVPLIFADKTGTVVAVVHAGWRGTLSQISKATLIEINKGFGIESSRVSCVIGPSVGGCCYEVSEDVASQFIDKFKDWNYFLFRKGNFKYILDLKKANSIALSKEGVEDVEIINICTKCSSDFHSYRRDGKNAGKQLSFIGLV